MKRTYILCGLFVLWFIAIGVLYAMEPLAGLIIFVVTSPFPLLIAMKLVFIRIKENREHGDSDKKPNSWPLRIIVAVALLVACLVFLIVYAAATYEHH